MKFNINGEEYTKASFDEKFGEEGYTVEFLYNKANSGDNTYNKVTGVVKTTADKFKYAVEVSQEGTKVNTATAADFADVTVKDDAVEKVTAAKLSHDLNHVTINNKTARFVATAAVNGLGEELTDEDQAVKNLVVERAISSDLSVAHFENGAIKAKKAGQVTFDVYFEGIKAPVKVDVEVVASQVATSIEAIADIKVQAGKFTAPTPVVLDQYGDKMTDDTLQTAFFDKDGKKVTADEINEKGSATYTAKVYVTDENDKDVQIGSYKVETVKVDANVTPDTYELSFVEADGKTLNELDVYKEGKKELTINVKGLYEGVELETAKFHKGLKGVTNNDDVVASYADGAITVTLGENAEAGDVVVTLQDKQEDLVINKVSTTVKVVNSAPQIEELDFIEANATAVTGTANTIEDADQVGFFTVEDILGQLTAGKTKDDDGEEVEILEDDMIKSINFLNRVKSEGKVTGTVVITLDSKFADEPFVFEAEVTVEEVGTPE